MKTTSALLKSLQELEVVPDKVEQPVEEIAAINARLDGFIKEATILTTLEYYGIYLIRDKSVPVADATMQIEKIISAVHERGDVDVSAIKHIKEYLADYRVDTKLRLQERERNKFVDHVLVEEFGELLEMSANTGGDEFKEFAAVVALQKQLCDATDKLIAKYKQYAIKHRDDFMESYRSLFEADFLNCFLGE